VQSTLTENLRGRDQIGAARRGPALLAGLLHCRRCGHKLLVAYKGCRSDIARYLCQRGFLDKGEPTCISFAGRAVDQAVAREILRVVQPAAIEAARLASAEQSRRADDVVAALQRDLEAARYSARRAQKQYDQADPENRLVADELERRWNQALQRVREVEAQIEQHHQRQGQTTTPTAEEFVELAADLEAIWSDDQTDARLKKRILRSLIRDIIVDVDAPAAEIVLVIHWKGGVHTELRLPRRRRGQNTTHTAKETIEAVRVLARICTDQSIAGFLNRNGLLTGRGNRWTQERVTALRSHHGIACYRPEQRDSQPWMNLTEAARQLHLTPRTLRLAAERGDITAEHPLPDGPWLFKRDELAASAAEQLTERVAQRRTGGALPSAEQASLEFSST